MAEPDQFLQDHLEYRFRSPDLLRRALTHRSHASEHAGDPDNESLEFLGDSVLGLIVSEDLFQQYPSAREGELSQMKAHFVSATHLHRCALQIGLGRFLRLGHGEERSGGRERKRLLANALEALIAAIHLDGGFEAAQAFVRQHVLSASCPEELQNIEHSNYKSALQAHAQTLGLPLPRYETVEVGGPEHAKIFTVEVRMGQWSSRGTGSSKKLASQVAAQALMTHFRTPAVATG